MIANYHTHTPRCNHATGSEQEYIQSALVAGMQILGFSDHTPYFFPGDYYSTFRMRPELLPDYVTTLQALKARYSGLIELHIGVEAEYYPKYFDRLLPYLQEQQVEYMILGQHFVGNEPDGVYSGRETTDTSLLERYVRQSIAAMDTGLYTYMAHPDILHYVGSPADYDEWMGLLAREAVDHEIPLEFNFLGYREGRNYPNRRFLELAAKVDAPMVLGCDAHCPQDLAKPETEKAARDILSDLGIRILDTVPLRQI